MLAHPRTSVYLNIYCGVIHDLHGVEPAKSSVPQWEIGKRKGLGEVRVWLILLGHGESTSRKPKLRWHDRPSLFGSILEYQ